MVTNYNSLAKSILENSDYMVLSTCDYLTKPWIAPVAYWIDDDTNLYCVSYVRSRHVTHIKMNHNVAVSIFNPSSIEGTGKGLQMSGSATILNTISDEVMEFSKKRIPNESLIATENRRLRWIKNNRVVIKIVINKLYINEFDSNVDYRIELIKPTNINLVKFRSKL